VQRGENGHALGVAERAGRRSPARRGALGPPPSVIGRPGHPERRARRSDAEPGPHLGHGRHQERAVSSSVPSNAAMFF